LTCRRLSPNVIKIEKRDVRHPRPGVRPERRGSPFQSPIRSPGRFNCFKSGAEILGSGNLDHRVGMQGNDEIAALSRAFDKMTDDLKPPPRRATS